SHDCESERTKRNQAVLDLVAGEIARHPAANSDTRSQRGLQQRDLPGLSIERVFPVDKNRLQKEHADEPEIRVAQNSQEKCPVLTHEPELGDQVSDKVETKFLLR